ncbi:M48 family metallopeptidase [Teichococcus oryzae]|uniref:M48 family metallopeptidase n=1 Tax=Teichococcus oryzae TaxID=1608942 RepID=A0A5B2TKE2_9PROT|nr:SprT family zinc-dependent metalloprotease [Pseudoroseomonas oryzae]KAA2214368.1 M48 family metallopeptidase [Pseudoroseomonas oryzae]
MRPEGGGAETVLLRPAADVPPWACALRWRRSARARRVSLRIDATAGEAVLTLPPGIARQAGLALLHRHADWVSARLRELPPALRFVDGTTIRLGDVPHPIRHQPALRGPAALRDGAILVGGPAEALPRRVLALLRLEAVRRITPRAQRHAATLAVQPRAIRLKDTRTRWASCAADGTLAFSWRLVMAPPWVLDYVVAHEVAHLREMNHSPRFWAHLAQLSPHRMAAQDWLKANGPALLRVG